MRIVDLDPSPFHSFDYRSASGEGRSETRSITVSRGRVTSLPGALDALVIASDLQGISLEGDRLVGEVLAEELATLGLRGVVPPATRTGVLLAGALYSASGADVRGTSGDVRSVWRAFAARFRWVAGVRGNQDSFGSSAEQQLFRALPGISLLDDVSAVLDGLRVGGVGGIIGDAARPGRRDERGFLRALRQVLDEKPEVLVLHHGPDADRGKLRGHPEVRRALDRSGPLLVVCGHVYWPTPMVDIRGGAQVLNADGRVVLLERQAPPS